MRTDAFWNVSQIWRSESMVELAGTVDELLIGAAKHDHVDDRREALDRYAAIAAEEQLYVSLWMTHSRAVAARDVSDVKVLWENRFCFWRAWRASD